jgi:rSAM/selenodomain-associated transferase 1
MYIQKSRVHLVRLAMEPQPRRVLGLLAKQPQPGLAKTRLAAETSPEWAARVSGAFLNDSVERLTAIEAQRVLVYAPREAEAYFARLVSGRFTLMPQVEGDLGQRIAAFFSNLVASQPQLANRAGSDNEARELGIKTVLVGVDSPTLPLSYIEEAFAKLARVDLVLGPATDGGYYLVGCAGRVPPIFENISWSQPTVLDDTVNLLKNTEWRLELLPPWYDVDTLSDWRMLRGHLAALRRAGVKAGLPCTEALAFESDSW